MKFCEFISATILHLFYDMLWESWTAAWNLWNTLCLLFYWNPFIDLHFFQSAFGDKLAFYIFVEYTVELCRVVSLQVVHQVLSLLWADMHLIIS